jgi:hypothetical protein
MYIVLNAVRWLGLRTKYVLSAAKKVKLKERSVELVALTECILCTIRKEVYVI